MEEVQSFSCRIDNVKSITDVLTCLSGDLNKDQPCYIEVTNEGMPILFLLLLSIIVFHSYDDDCNRQRESFSGSAYCSS